MGIGETLLFYLVIGLAVAVAVHARNSRTGSGSAFQTFSALPFWPVYLPIILSGEPTATKIENPSSPIEEDDMAIAIRQVEGELSLALTSLDGWAEAALAGEAERIQTLKSTWRAQAERMRDLDQVLNQLNASPRPMSDAPLAQRGDAIQRQNLDRLEEIRRLGHEELMTTLASVRGLATSIHVAKFTGAPLPRAEELVREIAAAVDGLTEVGAWRAATDGDLLRHPRPQPVR